MERDCFLYDNFVCNTNYIYIGFVIFTKLNVECFTNNGMQSCNIEDILSWDNFNEVIPKLLISIAIAVVYYLFRGSTKKNGGNEKE